MREYLTVKFAHPQAVLVFGVSFFAVFNTETVFDARFGYVIGEVLEHFVCIGIDG